MLILDPLTCGADQDEDIQVQRMTFSSQPVPPAPTAHLPLHPPLPALPVKVLGGGALATEK